MDSAGIVASIGKRLRHASRVLNVVHGGKVNWYSGRYSGNGFLVGVISFLWPVQTIGFQDTLRVIPSAVTFFDILDAKLFPFGNLNFTPPPIGGVLLALGVGHGIIHAFHRYLIRETTCLAVPDLASHRHLGRPDLNCFPIGVMTTYGQV